jgi:uncharacterized membrane protein YsdA (DUF1294 family)
METMTLPTDLLVSIGLETVLFYIWLLVVGINLTAFAMFGIDKSRSINGQWRISEKALLQIAFLGGWAGLMQGAATFATKLANSHFARD